MPRFAIACALLLAPALCQAQAPKKSNKFGWFTDYAAAKAEARRSGKPIFLVFRCEP